MATDCLLQTNFPDLKLFRKGKVRDVYDLGDSLLVVSTDRISCFDVVLPSGIPDKGKVLTGLSCFWFEFLRDVCKHHFITADVDRYPGQLKKYRAQLEGRSMIVIKASPVPVECIVRGYLSGSGWKEYRQSQSVCGIALPAGLRQSDKLPEVIFTPSTKAEFGHDQNVTQETVEQTVGKEIAAQLKDKSMQIYTRAAEYALRKGIIIADTKFEFGYYQGALLLIDEVLTPDSSRFWPAAAYSPGKAQPSFDKQFVRDYLETLDWDKTPPAPELPEEIIQKTSRKYREAFRLLAYEKS